MEKIKSKDLKKLGFKKEVESDNEDPFHYYCYEVNNDCLLISCGNNEKVNGAYVVEIFEMNDIQFTDLKQLKKFVKIIKKASK